MKTALSSLHTFTLCQIFTNDLEEVRELDRVRVVRHLEDTCQDKTEIVQQYLVSVVEGWGGKSNWVGGGWSGVKWGVEWGG